MIDADKCRSSILIMHNNMELMNHFGPPREAGWVPEVLLVIWTERTESLNKMCVLLDQSPTKSKITGSLLCKKQNRISWNWRESQSHRQDQIKALEPLVVQFGEEYWWFTGSRLLFLSLWFWCCTWHESSYLIRTPWLLSPRTFGTCPIHSN